MGNKIYTTTKYSYNEDNECFLPGLFCHTAVTEEQLLFFVWKYISDESVKEKWMAKDKDDLNCFYVTYTDGFEKNLYHGYRVTVTDLTSGKTDVVDKNSYPELWDKINNIVNETI